MARDQGGAGGGAGLPARACSPAAAHARTTSPARRLAAWGSPGAARTRKERRGEHGRASRCQHVPAHAPRTRAWPMWQTRAVRQLQRPTRGAVRLLQRRARRGERGRGEARAGRRGGLRVVLRVVKRVRGACARLGGSSGWRTPGDERSDGAVSGGGGGGGDTSGLGEERAGVFSRVSARFPRLSRAWPRETPSRTG